MGRRHEALADEIIKHQLVFSLADLEYELDISEVDNSKSVVKKVTEKIKAVILEMERLAQTHNISFSSSATIKDIT